MLASQPSRTPRRGHRTVPQRVQEVLSRLQAAYGRPRNTDRRAPLDELILTVLSQNTNDRNRDRAYALLRGRYPRWEDVLAATRRAL